MLLGNVCSYRKTRVDDGGGIALAASIPFYSLDVEFVCRISVFTTSESLLCHISS